MKPKYYWIKERYNPQLGTYYSFLGNISVKEALQWEKTLYGLNFMHKFETKDKYDSEIEKLRSSGAKILR